MSLELKINAEELGNINLWYICAKFKISSRFALKMNLKHVIRIYHVFLIQHKFEGYCTCYNNSVRVQSPSSRYSWIS